MKMPLTLMMLLLAISFSSMKCQKEETDKTEKLPEETQTGKETFGCLVNGEVWLPGGTFPYSALTVSFQNDIFSMTASKISESIHLDIRNLQNPMEYPLSGEQAEYSKGSELYKSTNGILKVSNYDKTSRIISGTFSFTAKNRLGDSVIIKDGRFDVKY